MTQQTTKLDPGALDPEEREILKAYEEGRLRRASGSTLATQRLESAASETLRKDRRINIRLPSHDLVEIKRLAAREGVPYQTLISSILHKYATGELG